MSFLNYINMPECNQGTDGWSIAETAAGQASADSRKTVTG